MLASAKQKITHSRGRLKEKTLSIHGKIKYAVSMNFRDAFRMFACLYAPHDTACHTYGRNERHAGMNSTNGMHVHKAEMMKGGTFTDTTSENMKCLLTRLIPEMYDWHASHSPEHPLFIYPEDDGRVETTTWATAAHAIHLAGHWLLSLVGTPASASNNTDARPLVAILANAGI